MDDTTIVAVYVVLDDLLRAVGHRSHPLAPVTDAEVLTVAVVAACRFGNHHERALCVLRGMGYIPHALSVSRFNRRAHALVAHLAFVFDALAAVFAQGTAFVVDSLPVPACRYVRGGRCRKVTGKAFVGHCVAKQERFFGWRLHLLCDVRGVPVAFDLLPASLHDLTPIYELTAHLPAGSWVYGDKGYNSADDEAWLDGEWGIRLIPKRRKNMLPNTPEEWAGLCQHRQRIETVNSQLEAWGVERLHARTAAGVHLKVLASLVALAILNAH